LQIETEAAPKVRFSDTWRSFDIPTSLSYIRFMMRFHIISLFPHLVESYVSDSILSRAAEKKLVSFKFYNPRSFTNDKHARVDRRPYGGGPGMVLEAESVLKAAQHALRAIKTKTGTKTKVVFFATDGKQFTNALARQWTKKYDDIIFLCGRYEGIDARAPKILKAEKISVGPYVLTGGEVPAMIVIDAVARQIVGVLGKFASLEEERVASPDVYTRPEVFVWKKKKYRVPKILLSGHHAKVEEWKTKKRQ
jgi:tRNA (guanine37-N1)-methyltransferase